MACVGYARVSTLDPSRSLQEDAPGAAACEQIYGNRASGPLAEQPELGRAC